jgi:hypothetical protein
MMHFTDIGRYKPVFVDPPDIPQIALKDIRNKLKNMKKAADEDHVDDEDDEFATVQAAMTDDDIHALKTYVMQGLNAVTAHALASTPSSVTHGGRLWYDDAPEDAMQHIADVLRQMALWIHTHVDAYMMLYADVGREVCALAEAARTISNGIDSRAWGSDDVLSALQDVRYSLL